jgi:hypothetical protein
MSCNKMYQYFVNILGLSKVLVTTGYDEGSKKIEVIDLANSTNVCQPSVLEDYPLDASEASGGLLNNNIALICGGSNPQTTNVWNGAVGFLKNSIFWLIWVLSTSR